MKINIMNKMGLMKKHKRIQAEIYHDISNHYNYGSPCEATDYIL